MIYPVFDDTLSMGGEGNFSPTFDLVCLSHLRWDFVYQRPQHLLSRAAKQRRVFFVEEPVFVDGLVSLDVSQRDDHLYIITPLLPKHLSLSKQIVERLQPQFVDEACREEVNALQKQLLDEFLTAFKIETYALWYYTPMALAFSEHLEPAATIYDCMDELSAFKHAPPALRTNEAELLRRADLVFTGGQSLYEAKRSLHPHVSAFPSSVDAAHFQHARLPQREPSDQKDIAHPRLGFYGVIDERFDIDMLTMLADARPDWQIILLGPVVKIEPSALPQRPNIHYLGAKTYEELPTYLSGWDVALLPFAHNDSTRFISPTKTLEYLAGGKPVVSTSIRDVVSPYGTQGLVRIADTPDAFVAAIQEALDEEKETSLPKVDAFLAHTSWDITWDKMYQLIETVVTQHQRNTREDAVHV